MLEKKTVTLTTSAGGAATGYIAVPYGRLIEIQYTKTDFATGVDFTITGENTGEGIWTQANVDASVSKYPRILNDDTVGGATSIRETYAMVDDRIKFVVAAGGATKTGAFAVIIER